MDIFELMKRFGVPQTVLQNGNLPVRSPIDGALLANIRTHNANQTTAAVNRAHQAFLAWRMVPAPRRGELVRLLGNTLRVHKKDLGTLITLETGKILQEGLGEVQEMIDICDFAVGLSRQLYGLTIASERPGHRMMESWHPLGVCGIISAFNFPAAVWAWNAALAFVCGNSVVWKPSEKSPLTGLACAALFEQACVAFGDAPDGLLEVVQGARAVGDVLVNDVRVPLISATGSTRMGREVGARVAERFGRSILELGGNNAAIIAPSADLSMVVRGVLFAAVGTAGQRCTTLRRLIVHNDVYDTLIPQLRQAYGNIKIGNPLHGDTLVGPLIDVKSFDTMQQALHVARSQGGKITGGAQVDVAGCMDGFYVRPALVEMPQQTELVRHETFGPILYILRYDDFAEAIALQNGVSQGLSSSIFTMNMREAELFVSAVGSDCGIANVNIGPSGAEIGGAFGGEKDTGGGRESGSDSWRAYMRRATNTINYSDTLPLAQGIVFNL
ncbi:L-piperidine-6-carboxylate dehydrogenase [Glaciimonas immobilis]|uniref:aldehyde dehydrogenase (NAD(+)) n=1 Tax=Glaciimonas immobilis TaxID=728004 RepID=A0A840RZX8_9BURK|nr:aldehyde dehydrogenase family protein [Glaciimonas immobilis]KAF3998337.1 aldehyde dehydrogenase family protein [Glaciimonas immobilis]MBB5201960.1 aldehyde dehydrogenase (NAD+) [Glaciimonas immobilis]